MRSIKFRAWYQVERTMFPGIHPAKFGEDNEYGPYWHVEEEDDCGVKNLFDHTSVSSLQELVLMQFIGVCDKNNKEIYEGDIIEINGGRGHVISAPGAFLMDFGDEKISFLFDDVVSGKYQIEVVGNIYENELLPAEDNN